MNSNAGLFLIPLLLISGPGRVGAADPPPSEPAVAGDRIFGIQGHAGDIDYFTLDLTRHTPSHAVIRSVFIPGWGQAFNRQKTKGALLLAMVAAAGTGSLILNHEADQDYDEYKARGSKDDPLYDDYETKNTQATILGVAALFLWGFSIVDAYRNAYKPLWSRREGVDVAVSGDQGWLRYRRAF